LDNQYTVRVHLGMHGLWHRYPLPWTARGEIHLLLESEREVFVCLQPKEVEILKSSQMRRHPALTGLGPDLLGAEPDWDRVWQRLLQHSPVGRELGEVLLDQRIAAGLGNVYKNELCFLGPLAQDKAWVPLCGTSPYTAWNQCTRAELIGMLQRGRQLLLANLGGWPRTTTADGRGLTPGRSRCWVYERQGRPCLRCGAPLVARPQGLQARATCWCPACQPLNRWGTPTKSAPLAGNRPD
jgi:endonuclease-8